MGKSDLIFFIKYFIRFIFLFRIITILMIRYFPIFLICVFLFGSCAVQHKSLSGIKEWSYPQNQFDKQFDFSYVDDVLDKTNNKRSASWAKRKDIHVISIRLINNGKNPVHGMQISFYNGDDRAEIIHNNWLAKKVRQRFSPLMILWLPVFVVEAALFHKDDDDTDNFYRSPYEPEPYYITEELANQAENNTILDFKCRIKCIQIVMVPGY